MKHRVILADDHKLFIEGIAGMLSAVEGIEIAGKAHTGKDALQMTLDKKPDLVVLDITMPDMYGIEVTRKIKAKLPDVKILILSMHLDLRMIIEVLQAGADAYTLKDSEPSELLTAVKNVLAGKMYLSSKVIKLLVRDYISKHSVPLSLEQLKDLSARERQVLSLISESKSIKEIAEELHISRSTADTHKANLMRKLGCENTNELIRFAMREGIVDLDE
ncbi:MAG: response regulator transcription factor [Synergistaceae bacterium]|nr:response regulator transcription factor [Synergistaceae bacterium]MDD3673557.1 response regulator transcription factor [Synergistaceae bacterium]MDD4705495.1 response regulator transcription factor [Synergistaceae bacterium]NLW62319.1 response regulator transcription factor [Synergistaceae bacterium]